MSDVQLWTLIFVIITFSFYIYISFRSRVSDTAGFYVAGGGITAPATGAAIAAAWLSTASFTSARSKNFVPPTIRYGMRPMRSDSSRTRDCACTR